MTFYFIAFLFLILPLWIIFMVHSNGMSLPIFLIFKYWNILFSYYFQFDVNLIAIFQVLILLLKIYMNMHFCVFDTDRSLRIGSNNGGSTNNDSPSAEYSVSFVPLFTLLANFFPRLFSRFSGVNQPAARGIIKA